MPSPDPNPNAPDSPADGFRSLAELQARHAVVCDRVGKDKDLLAPKILTIIKQFIQKAVSTGTVLDAKGDRASAQSLINFWIARLGTAAREAKAKQGGRHVSIPEFDDTLLAAFNPKEIAVAAAAADTRLAAATEDERQLARRVLLRLVRMRPTGTEFDAVSTVRVVLSDLDNPEKVDKILLELEDTGVVRRRPGDSPDLDRFSLRAPDLITTWPTFAGWLKDRVAFRERATAWNSGGRYWIVTGPTENEVEEARLYQDRNAAERAYLEAFNAQERRRQERGRRRQVILVCVLVSVILLFIVSWIGWSASARHARDADAQRRDTDAQRLLAEKQRQLAEQQFAQVFANYLVKFGEEGSGVELQLWAARRAAAALRTSGIDPKTSPAVVALFGRCLGPQQPTVTVPTQHTGAISALALSRDGRQLVTGGEDKTAEVWEIKDPRLLKTFPPARDPKLGHTDRILGVAFSPDGKWVATASADRRAILWNLDSDLRLPLVGHRTSVLAVTFSSDGKRVATVDADGTPLLWDATKGQGLLALATSDANLPPASKKPVAPPDAKPEDPAPRVPKGRPYAIAFDPTGRHLAVAGWDGRTRIWDTVTGELTFPALVPDTAPSPPTALWFERGPAVAFSPNGQQLAVGDGRGVLEFWDATAGKPIYPPTYAGSRPRSSPIVCADPAGWLAYPTFGTALQVSVWKGGSRSGTMWLPQVGRPPTALAFTPDAGRIAIVPDRSDLPEGSTRAPVEVYDLRPVEDPVTEGEARIEPPSARPALVQYKALLAGLAPEYGEPLMKAQEQVFNGEYDQAVQLIEKGLSLPGLKPEAAGEAKRLVAGLVWTRGLNLARNAEVEEAVAALDKARALDPSLPTDTRVRATKLAAQGYLLKARAAAAGAVTLDQGRVNVDGDRLANSAKLLRQAKELSPNIDPLEPEVGAKVLVAQALADQVPFLAHQGRIGDALAACEQARKFENQPGRAIDANTLNELCWWGSLWGKADKVKFAGEEAVKLAPENREFQDTRGLSRALTGEPLKAAEDFEAYAAWKNAPKALAEKRLLWAASLRAGKNPFSPEVLKELRSEGEGPTGAP